MFNKFVTALFVFASFVVSSNSAWSCEKLGVKGITCSSCAQKIEAAFKELPEVESAHVDAKAGSLQLHYKKDKSLTKEQIDSILKKTGDYKLELKEKSS